MTRPIPTHVRTGTQQLPCEANRDLYDFVARPGDFDRVRRRSELRASAQDAAETLCRSCPRFAECLRDALTGPSTEEYLAATTPRQRAEMRDLLDVEEVPGTITSEDTGRSVKGQPVAPEVIARKIARHPEWHATQIAEALGIDSQTVRRHQRRYPDGYPVRTPSAPISRADAETAWELLAHSAA